MRVRAVLWTVYGTLVAVPQGELLFEHPMDFVTDAALDKVIKEFKMWNSMSRKPGVPAAYMRELYTKALAHLRLAGGGEVPQRGGLGRHREEAHAEGVHATTRRTTARSTIT